MITQQQKDCYHQLVSGAGGMSDAVVCEICGLKKYPEVFPELEKFRKAGRIREVEPGESFHDEYPYVRSKARTIVITGCASGLGRAIAVRLVKDWDVIGVDLLSGNPEFPAGLGEFHAVNVSRHAEVYEVFSSHGKMQKPIDVLVNCAGINRISSLEDLTAGEWSMVMDTNAQSIYNMTRTCLHSLKKTKGTVVNIVSNASHIPMTHSLAYNASKAAAAMMTRQLARELTRAHGITVFGINPNKLAGTRMSKYIEERVPEMRGWTPKEAKEYQMKGITCGFETEPDWIAELLVWLLEEPHRHKYLSGCLLDLGN